MKYICNEIYIYIYIYYIGSCYLIGAPPETWEKPEVQFAAGGRQIAPTFTFIGAPPETWEKTEVQFAAGGRQIAPTFTFIGEAGGRLLHLSGRPEADFYIHRFQRTYYTSI